MIAAEPVPPAFYTGFWIACVITALLLFWYYWRMDAEQLEILRMLTSSVMPLGTLTLVVLGVILFGITTATESAAVSHSPRASSRRARQARRYNRQVSSPRSVQYASPAASGASTCANLRSRTGQQTSAL